MDTVGGFIQQPFVAIMFAMMCFFGLLLLGVIGWMIRSRNLKAQASTPPGAATSETDNAVHLPALDMLLDTSSLLADDAPARKSRSGTFTLNVVEGENVDAVEVMTVLRDVVNGTLIVQINDKAYKSLADSGDAEFRDRFIKVMRELSQIAAKVSKAPATTPPDAEPVAKPVVAPTSDPASEAAPQVPVETAPKPPPARPKLSSSLPPPPPTEEGALPGDLPKFSLDSQPPPAPPPGLLRGVIGGKKAPSNPIPEINIAGAIEAFLQHKLRSTPDYAGRSIHVHPSPDGGVSIQVDGAFYDAVSDVADTEVREFIATTIQEWQERH